MKSLLLGLLFLAAAVVGAFYWWADVLAFLRGALPVLALLVAAVALLIGIADMKDKAEAKKEEATEAESADSK